MGPMASGLKMKRSISTLSDMSAPERDVPESKPQRTDACSPKAAAVTLASHARCPSYGAVHPAMGAKKVFLWQPHWGLQIPDCGPLNMTLVPPRNTKKAQAHARTTKLQTSKLTKNAFGTIRCFSATHRATQTHLSKRGCQDLATQLFHWDFYQSSCRKLKMPRGKFLAPHVAEFLTGLPAGWTSQERGAVSLQEFHRLFPHLRPEACQSEKLKGLSLFSGIAALELGLSEFIEPMGYVECNSACQRVLEARIQDGLLPPGPVYDNICGLQLTEAMKHEIRSLTGGFPCQGASTAGKQLGLEDERSALVKEVFKVMDQCVNLQLVLLENVKNLFAAKLRPLLIFVLQELLQRGFSVRWCVVSGRMCGLHVNRDRVFIMATKTRCAAMFQAGIQIKSEKEIHEEANKCWNLRNQPPITTWLAQSLGKHDLHRLHAIGNMVLPKCACLAMHLLLHAHRQETA